MRERIIEIGSQDHLSHIGSCLNMTEVLEIVYQIKKPEDIIILDAGHAHPAHLAAEKSMKEKK